MAMYVNVKSMTFIRPTKYFYRYFSLKIDFMRPNWQARHFRFCLGGANALEAQPEKNFAPQARKFFALFARKSSYTPLKTVFSSDLAHYEMKIQVFLYLFSFFCRKIIILPPPRNPWGGQTGSWGGQLPPPRPPNDGPDSLPRLLNLLCTEI